MTIFLSQGWGWEGRNVSESCSIQQLHNNYPRRRQAYVRSSCNHSTCLLDSFYCLGPEMMAHAYTEENLSRIAANLVKILMTKTMLIWIYKSLYNIADRREAETIQLMSVVSPIVNNAHCNTWSMLGNGVRDLPAYLFLRKNRNWTSKRRRRQSESLQKKVKSGNSLVTTKNT